MRNIVQDQGSTKAYPKKKYEPIKGGKKEIDDTGHFIGKHGCLFWLDRSTRTDRREDETAAKTKKNPKKNESD